MGNQVDADLAAADVVNVISQVGDPVYCQAHAIDGDGAFVGQVFAQLARRAYAQFPTFAYFGEMCDAANAIDMAGNDVTTQAVMGAKGFFKVDDAGFSQAAGFCQGFGRNIDGKSVVGDVQRHGRHAGAVECNAVTQTHVVEVTRRRFNGEALAMV